MPRYIAFLRAINVGGRIVKMDRLRTIFGSLDVEHVETFIASGNVVFDSTATDTRALERRIEQHLERALGYEVATFLRTTAEVAAIAAHQPFGRPDPLAAAHPLSIALLKAPPSDAAQRKLMGFQSALDEFHVRQREVYWLCRLTRVSESAFSGALLEKTLGTPATIRNVTTVRRLAAKYAA